MTDRLIFISSKDANCDHTTDAPMIAIKLNEEGFFPIYTRATADQLNDSTVTPEITESALIASIFGWHVPGAKAAID